MKDRKFHTDKGLKDNYPKPGVPEDEAWAEMNKVLDAGAQDPPEPGGGSAIIGGKKFFWQYALVVAIVIGTIWAYYKKHSSQKALTATTILAAKNQIKKDRPGADDTAKYLNNKIEKTADKSIAINDSVSKINSTVTITETKPLNKPVEKDRVALLHNDTAGSLLPKTKMNILAINNANSVTGVYRNNTAKNNTLKNEKKKNHKQTGKDLGAGSLVHSGAARTNHNAGKDKTHIDEKTNADLRNRQNQLNASGHNKRASTNKYLASEINIPGTSLSANIISFIKEPISIDTLNEPRVDSSYLQKINGAVNDLALKKHNIKSRGKIKDANKKSATDFEYGLQWDADIPVQGTSNYFTGTNGNSKPYNIIIPQLWLSKGLNNNSRIFLEIDVNHQYFIGNEEVAADTPVSPRDSASHKIFLSKVSGFGATLQYSYRIHKNWAAAIGINYSSNRKALLHKQNISLYGGSIVSDSLYGIKRSSADWQYINKSQVSGNFELWYIFKKFNLGAAVNLPLSNIPVYNNKNIHPVNAQLFLRWNIKKD